MKQKRTNIERTVIDDNVVAGNRAYVIVRNVYLPTHEVLYNVSYRALRNGIGYGPSNLLEKNVLTISMIQFEDWQSEPFLNATASGYASLDDAHKAIELHAKRPYAFTAKGAAR